MYYRAILNDIRKSKAITFTTMLFVAAAALLVSLAAILVVNLFGRHRHPDDPGPRPRISCKCTQAN